ncbi:putative peptide hydrolase NDAI_0H02690 [Naumovozyma dairenensis CBS 421]|uniref:DUF159-domain-containing protein n=1 Tax=Naumovozyma dairenensis (strain ATCC 10597 / BCRC 20456 / CBS 421 / NBRC 0211 / NRRL Y-12639) TaxID=1071378 RepID=G0WF82_NAUDC|nr:hypothetical protein NDAI_0H02690 [Naumovozyma dairenensis CBS 421]CCD26443.1 hypothetical protein NDAI_0H02690 [Naumovozyma dairenensis CBS 421]
MCGRFALEITGREVADQIVNDFYLDIIESEEEVETGAVPEEGEEDIREERGNGLGKSYNVAPTSFVNVYTNSHHLRTMKWGLIPQWIARSKMDSYNSGRTINARLETLSSKRIWKGCLKYKRCVIPVSGYYEWQKKKGEKIPYYVKRKDNKLIFLAGLYDHLNQEQTNGSKGEKSEGKVEIKEREQTLYSFTIVTGVAPDSLKWLHDRMPTVLEPGSKEWNEWLNEDKTEWTQKELYDTLKPTYNESLMESYQVSKDVGSVKNKGEYLVEPVQTATPIKPKKESSRNGSELKKEEGTDGKRHGVKKEQEEKEVEEGVGQKGDEEYQEPEKGQQGEVKGEEEEKVPIKKGKGSSSSSSSSKKDTKGNKRDITSMLRSSTRDKTGKSGEEHVPRPKKERKR